MSSNSERTRQTLEAMREAVDAFRYRLSFQQSEWELLLGSTHIRICAAMQQLKPFGLCKRSATALTAYYVLFTQPSKTSCKLTSDPLACI